MTVRRLKTYTAQTGYVYEYYFVGKRPALADDPLAPATEFIFDISSDRKTTCAVSVFLSPQVLEAYAASHGRTLSEPEQYAAVKMRLLQALDEIADMLHAWPPPDSRCRSAGDAARIRGHRLEHVRRHRNGDTSTLTSWRKLRSIRRRVREHRVHSN